MEERHIPPRGIIEMEEHGGGGAGWRRMEGQFLIKQRFVFVQFRTFPTANLSSQFLRALPLHFTSLEVSFSFSLVYRRDRVSGGQFFE